MDRRANLISMGNDQIIVYCFVSNRRFVSRTSRSTRCHANRLQQQQGEMFFQKMGKYTKYRLIFVVDLK